MAYVKDNLLNDLYETVLNYSALKKITTILFTSRLFRSLRLTAK